ncbi:protein FAM150-like isoform X1 [Sinocyclocheilus anshuiensis]|uniref:protein FAM150-like isoform X1 n=1 Tax=Sinocyclocheilus anshuiensis TaxID=1608454 RepID=UPI0007B87E10|nr:PREDICTED: protein FAM150-like isoform X1 [Sinocyclocheilus anshuiensis]XP_016356893.1 PREDICTED: protein FAM150-like isoform X1 [Sinocyclocheilus anshuiensis]
MRAEKRWHILLSMILLLITSSQCMDSKEVKESERKTLLNLILQVIGDKPASRRVTSGLYSVSQDVKFSSREKTAQLSNNSRPIEIVPRDISMKGKFIEHFTAGPVKFPSECRTHFHRIYHNTRECSRPTYYKRCARLLTRLAMSPLCTQS